MKILKNVLSVMASVLLWAIILLAALFAFTTLATKDSKSVANLAGFTPLSVMSESMAPTFNAGDLIIIKQCDTKKLEAGDIITFHTIINNEYALNTHRISEIQDMGGVRSYVTKGDNNLIADVHMIADGDIVGKFVTKLPGVGEQDETGIEDLALRCSFQKSRTVGTFRKLDYEDMLQIYRAANG